MQKPMRYTLLGIVLLVIILMTTCDQKEDQPLFTFIFMTDIHVQPEREASAGLSQALVKAEALHPDLIVTGGDLIMDALGQSYGRADSLYQLYDQLTANVKVPIYNTLGNHEVFGLYEKSGISPDHPEYGKQMFLNRMDLKQTYYSFDHKGWHFVILDAIGFTDDRRYYGHIDSLQLEWLAEDLAGAGPEKPIIMSTHIPFVSVVPQLVNGSQEPVGKGYIIINSHEVIEVIEPYNVKLVLQGHLHHLEETAVRDMSFVTAGSVSARWWLGPYEGTEEGFLHVKVYPDSLDWGYVDYGWEVAKKEVSTQK